MTGEIEQSLGKIQPAKRLLDAAAAEIGHSPTPNTAPSKPYDRSAGLGAPGRDAGRGCLMAKEPLQAPTSAKVSIMAGLLLIGGTFFGAGIWAATAPLASAVTAPGNVVVIGRQRKVQHLEGGLIQNIRVAEGDVVKAGDLLMTLDPISARAEAERLRSQLDLRLATRDRLTSEQLGLDTIRFGLELSERANRKSVDALLNVQRQEFIERQRTLSGTIDVLNQRIEQLSSGIEGSLAQREAFLEQMGHLEEEIGILEALLDKGLARRSEVLRLRRESASLRGQIGEIGGQIAQSQERIGETKLEILQTKQKFRQDVAASLTEEEAKVADLRQQLIVAEDVLTRVDVYAPISGVVQNLAVTTLGGVIAPGEALMEITPNSGELLIEAQVSPLDIDKVTIGQEAELRFSALDLRNTPSVFGEVRTKSGDTIVEQSNRPPYYRVQIATMPDELNKLGGQELQPGMPADVLIKTRDRTLLNYLTKPLTDALSQGLREE